MKRIRPDDPVQALVQVTRASVRRYRLAFPTFREAAARLTAAEARRKAFRWLETTPA